MSAKWSHFKLKREKEKKKKSLVISSSSSLGRKIAWNQKISDLGNSKRKKGRPMNALSAPQPPRCGPTKLRRVFYQLPQNRGDHDFPRLYVDYTKKAIMALEHFMIWKQNFIVDKFNKLNLPTFGTLVNHQVDDQTHTWPQDLSINYFSLVLLN